MICRGSELDSLFLVLLLVLVAHQTKLLQVCFDAVVSLVVVGGTWTSRARQRSMKTVRHGKIPVRSKWLVFWSLQSRFSINRAYGGSLRKARGPGGTLGSGRYRARSATCRGGADRQRFECENQGLELQPDCAMAATGLQRRQNAEGKDACGDGRDWLALVISSACICDRGGLQLLRLPGSLAQNGMVAGIMLHSRRPCQGTTPSAPMRQDY